MSTSSELAPTGIAWRSLSEPAEVAAAVIELYETRGSGRYSEVVSQVEHALQSGAHAMAAGADLATIVAALLHDIGHLLPGGHGARTEDPATDYRHEVVGARFLANWFGPAVTLPVQLHVPAKRYLCAVERDYFAGLSPASVRSLELQGGPMTSDEAVRFEAEPAFAEGVELRRWDDLAKVSGAPTPSLAVFGDMIVEVLEAD